MSAIDLEWEFNAPHWFDFAGQEAGEPDAWFNEEAQKIADQKIPKSSSIPEKAAPDAPQRRPTRIPVPAAHRMKSPSGARSQRLPSDLTRKAVTQMPAGKTATRIPLSERRNRAE
jgi:hypothetical protein